MCVIVLGLVRVVGPLRVTRDTSLVPRAHESVIALRTSWLASMADVCESLQSESSASPGVFVLLIVQTFVILLLPSVWPVLVVLLYLRILSSRLLFLPVSEAVTLPKDEVL